MSPIIEYIKAVGTLNDAAKRAGISQDQIVDTMAAAAAVKAHAKLSNLSVVEQDKALDALLAEMRATFSRIQARQEPAQ